MELLYLNIFCGITSILIFIYIIFSGHSSDDFVTDDITDTDDIETSRNADIGFIQYVSLQSLASALFGFALFGYVYYYIFASTSLITSCIGAFAVYIILKFQYRLIKKIQTIGERSIHKEIPLEGAVVKVIVDVCKDQKGLVLWKSSNNEEIEYMASIDPNSLNDKILEGERAIVRKYCGTYLVIL